MFKQMEKHNLDNSMSSDWDKVFKFYLYVIAFVYIQVYTSYRLSYPHWTYQGTIAAQLCPVFSTSVHDLVCSWCCFSSSEPFSKTEYHCYDPI